ncbi:hypothetical protein ABIB82_007794 [Bradyrhizobium sp. i1.8.4]|uniref:hypothetical protein n=1 Tax=unclassified Bradyrhizobium TaxID=2631580 RepID=UPI003D22BAEA
MLELLIVVLVTGIGFVSGYGVRELISRRRRRSPLRVHAPKERATNDDISSRWPPGTQLADHVTPPDGLDGAVRDLLGKLGRRTVTPSSAPRRRRQ